MSKVHCVPHDTGISFTYAGAGVCELWGRVMFDLHRLTTEVDLMSSGRRDLLVSMWGVSRRH